MVAVCSLNLSAPCPWIRLPKIYNPRPPHAAFLRRPCLGNAAGAATIGAMLRELDAFQRAASPEMGRVSGEGQASYGELESWLGSVVPASARVERICEIGLNRGESAVAWLCTFSAQYVGFDLAQYNVSLDAARFLRRAFPGRFRLVVGNSIATLPSWAVAHPASCDVVSVDGGHHFVEALSDLSYARLMARDGAAVVMTTRGAPRGGASRRNASHNNKASNTLVAIVAILSQTQSLLTVSRPSSPPLLDCGDE